MIPLKGSHLTRPRYGFRTIDICWDDGLITKCKSITALASHSMHAYRLGLCTSHMTVHDFGSLLSPKVRNGGICTSHSRNVVPTIQPQFDPRLKTKLSKTVVELATLLKVCSRLRTARLKPQGTDHRPAMTYKTIQPRPDCSELR